MVSKGFIIRILTYMNRKIVKYGPLLIIICLLQISKIYAQNRLSLDEAVQTALENNYDIKLNKNEVEQAKINVNRANAGMIPIVTGNLSTNNTLLNTIQTLSNGIVQERSGARNSNMVYGPVVNWQVFDGFQMFARYDRLKELENLGEANFKLAIQTTLADVINNYYDLVQQQQQIEALTGALEISRIRLRNSESRYTIGKADLNTDFSVTDTIIIGNNLLLPELLNSASQLNPSLQSALINKRISEINLREVKANRYPNINMIMGYNFNRSYSELGFARNSTGRGLNYGLTASVNIFNGFLQKRTEKNASLQIENNQLQYDRLNQSITSQLSSLFQTYQTNLQLVKLERQNLEVARQNINITLEKFRLGSVAPLEFREAQRNYIDANARYTNAQFEAKLAEVGLMQLSGRLNLQ